MKRSVLAMLLSTSLASGAAAEGRPTVPTAEEVNAASFQAQSEPASRARPDDERIDPVILKAQVLLDRAHVSPGVIDGFPGENTRKAIEAFERLSNLPADGRLDPEVWAKLTGSSDGPVLVAYTIRPDDVDGPFVAAIPDAFEAQSKLKRLAYTGPDELLAEKFHMDLDLLRALNPGKAFDQAGTPIIVAKVREPAPKASRSEPRSPKLARIEVDKRARQVRALRADGTIAGIYPATIGSDEKPAPSGEYIVQAVAWDPVYTYNPDYAFKGVRAKTKFDIQPGPNNPVGTVWIDLSLDSYGIHGTPEPAKIGKTWSHGCVRLTNWDAEQLASRVEKGTPVVFLD